MRTVRLICCLMMLIGVVAWRLDGANAQGSPDAQQACTPDAMRLCSDVIPDVAKVTACMHAKYSQLSQPCRVAMRGGAKETHHRHTRRARHCKHCS